MINDIFTARLWRVERRRRSWSHFNSISSFAQHWYIKKHSCLEFNKDMYNKFKGNDQDLAIRDAPILFQWVINQFNWIKLNLMFELWSVCMEVIHMKLVTLTTSLDLQYSSINILYLLHYLFCILYFQFIVNAKCWCCWKRYFIFKNVFCVIIFKNNQLKWHQRDNRQ